MRFYTFHNEVKHYLNRLERENGISVSAREATELNDRVTLLKKSGDWTRFSLGFNDGDADAYFKRAGVNNARGRFEVALFVRGMKGLNLYSNMVAWPMRDYQNAGSGVTVYSIGGLGIFNGTMINGLIWSVNGIVSTSISPNKVITTTRRVFNYSARTFFSAASVIQTTGSRDRLMSSGSSEPIYVVYATSCSGFHLGASNNGSGSNSSVAYTPTPSAIPRMSVSSGTKINGYGSYASVFGRRSLSHYQNKIQIGSTATTTDSWADSITDGANLHLMHCSDYTSLANTLGMVGTMSLACDLNIEVAPNIVHDLYKQTIGHGLNLP